MAEPSDWIDADDLIDPETDRGESGKDAGAAPGEGGQAVDDGRGRIFPCERCGADLTFATGQERLQCPFCGAIKEIPLEEGAEIVEQDFEAALGRLAEQKQSATPAEEHQEVRCESCGAEVIFDGTLTSTSCPYCGSPIQREKVHRGGFRIPVNGVLGFRVEQTKARGLLQDWVKSRWFAPNDFKKRGVSEKFHGTYLPFWTFDSLTFTAYVGERGDRYTVTVGSGKNRRTETRTRWSPRSGRFQRFFDDVLINATRELPAARIDELGPWPLRDCRPFRPEYLAGFFARTYDVELDEGFGLARARIEQELRADCCRRIGGDEQRVHSMDCRYDAIQFKHLLLPVWMLAYRYKERSYRVFVNAVTGEIQGDRPYSWVKITLAILAAVTAIATFVVLTKN